MGKVEYNKYLVKLTPLSRKDIEAFYVRPLERMFKKGVRVIEHEGSITKIILSGTRDDFYLDFEESGFIVLFWQGEITRYDFDYSINIEPVKGTEAYETYMMMGDKYHDFCRAEQVLNYIETIKDIACENDRPIANEETIKELYIDPLEKLFGSELRVEREKNRVEYIIFDGQREEFYLSFIDDYNRIDLFWENEQFIFDRKRELLGYDESVDNIVYENMHDISDNTKMANVILDIINVLNNGRLKSKQETETGEYAKLMRIEKLDYVLNIEKSGEDHAEYVFGNVKINVNE